MNYHLFQLINGPAGSNDRLDDALEWAATWLIFVIGVLAAIPVLTALRSKGWAALTRVVMSLLVAFAAGQLVAAGSSELRPFQTHPVHQLIPHAGGGSLPSDHATAAFSLAFAVGAFLSWRWGAALTALAVVVAFARVWTGVHYPSDVLAGAAIGAGVVSVIAVGGWLFDRVAPRPPPPPPLPLTG